MDRKQETVFHWEMMIGKVFFGIQWTDFRMQCNTKLWRKTHWTNKTKKNQQYSQ